MLDGSSDEEEQKAAGDAGSNDSVGEIVKVLDSKGE